MKKIYTKKQIAEAIAYWKKMAAMTESKKSNESEEDQEKAEKKEPKKEKKAEDTPKKEPKKEKKSAEDKPEKKAEKKPEPPAEEPETEEAPEGGSDDLDLGDDFGIPGGEEEETTGDTEETPAEDDVVTMEGPAEEDFTEDTPDDVEEPAETAEEPAEDVKEPEISEAEFFGYKNEVSEAAPGSARYEPNTVGAVMELLKKSDPNDRLFIKLTPGSIELIPIDIYRSIRMNGGITYMEVAKGKIKLRE